MTKTQGERIDPATLSLRQAVVRLAQQAAGIMEQHGCHYPLVICEGQEPFMAEPDFSSPTLKARSMHVIAQRARGLKASRVYMIAEAWMVMNPENRQVRASTHPRRQEALQVAGRDATGHTVQAIMPVYRRPNGSGGARSGSAGRVIVGSISVHETGKAGGRVEANILKDFFEERAAA